MLGDSKKLDWLEETFLGMEQAIGPNQWSWQR
jgi:hypothetical protein